MRLIQVKDFNPYGLHQRYVVLKANGEPTDRRAEYFVLRLDGHGRDATHIAASRAAARAYADFVENAGGDHLKKIGRELRAVVSQFEAFDPNDADTIDCRDYPV